MSSTTIASVPSTASRWAFISSPTAGWTRSLSAFSSSSSLKTISATAWRSRLPSADTIASPQRSTMPAKTEPPGACSSRTMRSASINTAPRSTRRSATVDLPDPMPPVSPISITPASVVITQWCPPHGDVPRVVKTAKRRHPRRAPPLRTSTSDGRIDRSGRSARVDHSSSETSTSTSSSTSTYSYSTPASPAGASSPCSA